MKKITFILLFPFQVLFSQNDKTEIIGLWEITKVTVGNEQMTPIAKWAEFKPDHTHRGGNGWVQHSIGTWHFDSKESSLKIITSNGLEDPFQPFKVTRNHDGMQWQRNEDGQTVTVSLKEIEEIPAAYSDKMTGLWQVNSIENQSGKPVQPFTEGVKLFLRMDKRYSIHLSTGRKGGVWQTHGHRQQVRLLSDDGDEADMSWQVYFEGKKMIWKNSEENVKLIFERVHRF